MKYRKLITILFFLIPFFSFGQSTPVDSTHEDCNERIFTQVEIPPSVKNGPAALADSISNYISAKNTSFKDGAIHFIFLVTAKGQILEIKNQNRYVPNESILKEALLFYSGMWIPGRQNTHIVCAYARCEMRFENKKLTLRIF